MPLALQILLCSLAVIPSLIIVAILVNLVAGRIAWDVESAKRGAQSRPIK